MLEAGEAPGLAELRLHNGTVYRWNRPIYDIVNGTARTCGSRTASCPAGPTIVDVLANAAFYYGVHPQMLDAGGPAGLDQDELRGGRAELPQRAPATASSPGSTGRASARSGPTELVLRHLLPLAHEGLAEWGVSQAVRDRYLSVIEGRCNSGRNGASWQIETTRRLEERGLNRHEALRQMLAAYAEHMHTNEPVHTWPVP